MAQLSFDSYDQAESVNKLNESACLSFELLSILKIFFFILLLTDLCISQACFDIFGNCASCGHWIYNLWEIPQEDHQTGSRFTSQCYTSKPNCD